MPSQWPRAEARRCGPSAYPRGPSGRRRRPSWDEAIGALGSGVLVALAQRLTLPTTRATLAVEPGAVELGASREQQMRRLKWLIVATVVAVAAYALLRPEPGEESGASESLPPATRESVDATSALEAAARAPIAADVDALPDGVAPMRVLVVTAGIPAAGASVALGGVFRSTGPDGRANFERCEPQAGGDATRVPLFARSGTGVAVVDMNEGLGTVSCDDGTYRLGPLRAGDHLPIAGDPWQKMTSPSFYRVQGKGFVLSDGAGSRMEDVGVVSIRDGETKVVDLEVGCLARSCVPLR